MGSYLIRMSLVVGLCFSAALVQPEQKSSANPPAKRMDQQASKSETAAMSSPQPSPEMRKLLNAFSGTWSITYKYEPSEGIPNGGAGQGKEVYRAGPGGFSLIEEFHSKEATDEASGLGLAWWDEKAQGYRAVWCVNSNPGGCIVMARLANWEGGQFVLGDESERMGKKMSFKEVLSDITPASFTQTLYQGESGAELKRFMTIKATKLTK
jgi:hypothetical protein